MSKKKEYSLIIFDWDGTLVDTVGNIVSALRQSASAMGLHELDDEAYKSVIGLSLDKAIAALYPELDDDKAALYREAYKQAYIELERVPSRPYPGVVKGLEKLKSAGVKLAVATGKRRPSLERSMQANECCDFFLASRTSDDADSKPSPMMLEQILCELNVQACQALMVGDSGFDLAMAANAGMDSVGVTYGAQQKSSLKTYDPVCVVDSFDELMDWLGPH